MKKIFSIVCACLVMMGANAMQSPLSGRQISQQLVKNASMKDCVLTDAFLQSVLHKQTIAMTEDNIVLTPQIVNAYYFGTDVEQGEDIPQAANERVLVLAKGSGSTLETVAQLAITGTEKNKIAGKYSSLISAHSYIMHESNKLENVTGNLEIVYIEDMDYLNPDDGEVYVFSKYQLKATLEAGGKQFSIDAPVFISLYDDFYNYYCNRGHTDYCEDVEIPLLDGKTPTGEVVNIEIVGSGELNNQTTTKGYFTAYGETNDYIVSLGVLAKSLVGTYTQDIGIYSVLYQKTASGEKTISLVSGSVKVVRNADLYSITAALTGKNGVVYNVTMSIDEAYMYDNYNDFSELTFKPSESKIIFDDANQRTIAVIANNSKGYFIEIQFFVAQRDPVIVIPASAYTIEDSEDNGTVMASPGQTKNGIEMSVAGYEGNDILNVWFITEGKVTTSNNSGMLQVVVDAKNTRGRSVKAIINVDPNNTPVENVEAEVNAAAKRIDANGQLIINRNGVDYNVLGF